MSGNETVCNLMLTHYFFFSSFQVEVHVLPVHIHVRRALPQEGEFAAPLIRLWLWPFKVSPELPVEERLLCEALVSNRKFIAK